MELFDFVEDYPFIGVPVLIVIVGLIMTPFIIIPFVIYDKSITGVYEYTDIDGNIGYGSKCYIDEKLICENDNNYVVEVKEFRKIK